MSNQATGRHEPVTNATYGHKQGARQNGPHTESKWAQHLLGTAETAGQRKRRITLARQRQYEIELAKPKFSNAKTVQATPKQLKTFKAFKAAKALIS
jgi:hypothetical protein